MLFFFTEKSNVTSGIKKTRKKTRKKKVKKFAFDHCKTCSERFVIWRDNFSFIFQRTEDKEMSEKRCYTVQELQEILGVSRKTIILLLLIKSIRNFWQKYWQIQRCGRCSIHWRRRWSNKFYIQINIFIVHMENISPSNPLKSPSFSIKIMEINSKWRSFQWEILIILQILRSCFNSKYGSI